MTWPTGFGTPNTDGLKLDKNTAVWNDIFEAFKTKVEADNGVGSLTEDQVDSITLVPYKVSRGNQTYGNYHVDCDVVIKCNFITVDFMVKNDSNVFGSILPNGKMTCPKGEAFPENKVPAAPEKDGYEFDGWYTNETYTTKADFDKPLTKDTTFYGKYTEKETPAPEPDDPKLDVNFKYEKNIVDVICETTSNHNASYRLMNGYYTVSDKKQLTNGNWQCKITIDLAKYFELYNSDSQHPGHTRDMNHPYATATMWISSTWSASSGQWSCAERLIDPAKIYVKCNATPTEYIPVTLTANSKTVTYNGEEQTVNDYTSNAPEGVTFEGITATGSGINAGEYTVKFSDGAVGKTDTTGKYIVDKTVDGKLTINKRSVTLTSETASKVYDGTPLTRPNVTVGGDGFVEGEVTDIRATGSVTNVSEGEVTNTITYTKGANFKADNYTITEELGKLTITPVTDEVIVTITGNTKTETYDGTEKTVEGYTVKSSNPLFTTADFTFNGTAKAKGTKVGTYPMGLKAADFENNNKNFSNVKFAVTDGSLTITEAPTYTFDLTDPDTIKVNKKFVSKYGRSAEMSFTATATIEKKEAYVVLTETLPSALRRTLL